MTDYDQHRMKVAIGRASTCRELAQEMRDLDMPVHAEYFEKAAQEYNSIAGAYKACQIIEAAS